MAAAAPTQPRTGFSIGKWIVYILVYALTLLWIIPVITAILTSFRTNDDIVKRGFFAVPTSISFQAYIEAWNRGGLSHYMPNSFIITLPALVATLFLSSLAGYALSRFKFPGNRLIFFMFVAGAMLPFQILLLPVFKLSDTLGIYDTYWAPILLHTAFQLGFCTFVLRNYMRTVPGEILEAARIDGCGEFGIYRRIMMPLTLPAIAALATLEFTWIFNDFLWALVLIQRDQLKPVTTGLSVLQGQFITEYSIIIAGSIIAALPTVLVFIFLQRYFIAGLTLGATKG
ncbi:MAG: carbohydrate ABC transporter permease [Anaerolineae bacterium]